MQTWEIWVCVVAVVVALFIALWYMRKKNRQKAEQNQMIKGNIPPDIMKIFEDAEGEMKHRLDNNLNIDPYDIMWSLANKKRLQGGANNNDNGKETYTEPKANVIFYEPESTESAEADIRADRESFSGTIQPEPGVSAQGTDETGGDIQNRSAESSGEDSKSSGTAKLGRGRPKGTVTYKDDAGNPINVYQWRSLQAKKRSAEKIRLRDEKLAEEVKAQSKSEKEVQNGESNIEN